MSRLPDYLDGRLRGTELWALRGHLDECESCMETQKEHLRIKEGLAALERDMPPAGTWAAIQNRLREEQAGAARKFGLSRLLVPASAMAALACLVGYLWWSQVGYIASPGESVARANQTPSFQEARMSRDQQTRRQMETIADNMETRIATIAPKMALDISADRNGFARLKREANGAEKQFAVYWTEIAHLQKTLDHVSSPRDDWAQEALSIGAGL